jgi:hypothetical protein
MGGNTRGISRPRLIYEKENSKHENRKDKFRAFVMKISYVIWYNYLIFGIKYRFEILNFGHWDLFGICDL